MISLSKYWLITVLFFFGMLGCASSDSITSTENENTVTEVPPTNIVEEVQIDKRIDVTINGRVTYSFVKRDTSWTGTATQFDTNNPETRKIVSKFTLNPTYGWSDFEEIVAFLNVYTMPDQSEIENRKVGDVTNQSRSYEFTIFDGNTTRSYSYFNPEGEAKEHWQSQHVTIFGSYIATEMKIVETVD